MVAIAANTALASALDASGYYWGAFAPTLRRSWIANSVASRRHNYFRLRAAWVFIDVDDMRNFAPCQSEIVVTPTTRDNLLQSPKKGPRQFRRGPFVVSVMYGRQ